MIIVCKAIQRIGSLLIETSQFVRLDLFNPRNTNSSIYNVSSPHALIGDNEEVISPEDELNENRKAEKNGKSSSEKQDENYVDKLTEKEKTSSEFLNLNKEVSFRKKYFIYKK